MRALLMYSISQQEYVRYNIVSSRVTQGGYVLYKLCNDWQQRTSQPDVCAAEYLFWCVHESRWPPTGCAIVVTKYCNCWLILLYIQKFAWREYENSRRLSGETFMSENRFLVTVFIILHRNRCNSTEFLFDHLEEREYYGYVRMEIWCEGVD